jgi:hypothetical protein
MPPQPVAHEGRTAFEKAVQVCLKGMEGRVSPEEVRAALFEAAEEAGVCVLA